LVKKCLKEKAWGKVIMVVSVEQREEKSRRGSYRESDVARQKGKRV